jgi:hypothetical protein
MKHKSLHDKGNELLSQVSREPDPEIRALMMESVKAYFHADIEIELSKAHRSSSRSILPLVVGYMLVLISTTLTSFLLGVALGACAFLASFTIVVFIVGAMLRMRDEVSESGFIALTKEGFKTMLFMNNPSRSRMISEGNHDQQ